MRSSNEPTVEEILESIKLVIARDNRASADQVRRQRETAGLRSEAASEDVEKRQDDVLDLTDSADIDPDEATFDDELDGPADEDVAEAPLLKAETQSNMRESLAALALLSGPGAQPQIVRSGETSLEGLVRELLRPALADWLEKNLPPLVERMVADEIRRISSKKG